MPTEKNLGTSAKIDLMFQKMFLDDNSMMVRIDRIEKKLDTPCPVGKMNKNKITGLCTAGSIVVGAIFSVIGYFHWWGIK